MKSLATIRNRRVLSYFIVCFIFLTGCKKKDATNADVGTAVIGTTVVDVIILNPTNNLVIHSDGEITHLEGRIEANANLGGWRVLVKDTSGLVVDTYEDLSVATLYIVHHHWLFDVQYNVNYEVVVQALTVNSEVIAENSINILCVP